MSRYTREIDTRAAAHKGLGDTRVQPLDVALSVWQATPGLRLRRDVLWRKILALAFVARLHEQELASGRRGRHPT